jgi:hypothetical protein
MEKIYKTPGVPLHPSVRAILAPGRDTGRWKVKQGAEIVGYVSDVKVGGIESTNCHARAAQQRDTHIELVLDPMASSPTQRVVVEVTPRWRAIMAAQGVDSSTRALRDRLLGRWMLRKPFRIEQVLRLLRQTVLPST